MESRYMETRYARYWLEDNIISIIWTPNLVVTVDVAKEMTDDRIRFCKGKALPFLADIDGLASVDAAARKHFASKRGLTHVKAGALFANSLLSTLVGNLYISVDKPEVPVKLFTDKKKALKWLKKYAS